MTMFDTDVDESECTCTGGRELGGWDKSYSEHAICCIATNKKKMIQIALKINNRENIATENWNFESGEKITKAKDEILHVMHVSSCPSNASILRNRGTKGG